MYEKNDLGTLQVLIVGGRTHAVQLLRQALNMLGIRQVQTAARPQAAIELLRSNRFEAVFCDENLAETDASAKGFVLAARRAPGILNPMVPIFLVCGGPRKRDIETARDLGFNAVLARPLSATAVKRKLRVALGRPRPFIVAGEFFGPDRRSLPRPWKGKDRRRRQPRKVKVTIGPDGAPVGE